MSETLPNGVPNPFMGSGVKRDLHTLFKKYLALKSNKIRDFADVFREMRFETILHYRINPPEYVEFAEYLLQNAALYFGKENEVKATRSFTERIFGIYTCYALYSLQPVDHVVQIAITQMQMEDLLQFQTILAASKALEPLAALKSLLMKKAFKLKVFQSTYDPATHKKYLAEEEMPDFGEELVEPFSRVKAFQNSQTLGELMYIHNNYLEAKQKLGLTEIKKVDRINPVAEIQKHLEKHQAALEVIHQRMASDESMVEEVSMSAGTSRSELRSRAYTAAMKHTRQRRYLDPNMEKNFKHLAKVTFGDIARECLEEEPGPSSTYESPNISIVGEVKKSKSKAKRKRISSLTEEPSEPTDQQIAEQVLAAEYAARVKPEMEPELPNEAAMFGEKPMGTARVAKIRAPPKKKQSMNRMEVKTERRQEAAATSSQIPFTSPNTSPQKAQTARAMPRVSDEWASRLHSFNGAMDATDKQLKKLQSRIKIESQDA